MKSLRELFLHELKDTYDAEHQVVEALPKMADAAASDRLAEAFRSHLGETQGQIDRLKTVFRSIGEEPARKKCVGMAGLVEEGKSVIKEQADSTVKDAALIGAAQRVEHYEMAAYGTLVAQANVLGFDEAAGLLQETLNEEKAADLLMTQIAGQVNEQAPEGKAVSGGQSTTVAFMAPPQPHKDTNGQKQIWVSPREAGGWAVHRTRSDEPLHVTETQAEAIELAREEARRIGGELVIQGTNGQIREKRSYGKDPEESDG